MSFYDNPDTSWAAAPQRQTSWEQPPPPSRSGTGSAVSSQPQQPQQPESNAFASQFEEIDRATDNLMKSGKWFPGPMQQMAPQAPRQNAMQPMGGRGYDGYGGGGDPRAQGPSGGRNVSGGDYEGARPGSAGLQGYYQGQRFPGGRPNEAEQMMQAKRRMAAQRERELRNYHQEQQYNRNAAVSGSGVNKSDRSLSPTTMSEEDRRELIARQHRALYGDSSSLYDSNLTTSARPTSSEYARAPNAARVGSPLAFDPYAAAGSEGAVQMPPRGGGAESTTSPVPQGFVAPSAAGQQQQSSRTSNSSPGASPPPGSGQQGGAKGVAPIGTRPPGAQQVQGAGSGKRSTTPLTPSSLSYGFNADGAQGQATGPKEDARASSAASNSNDGKGGVAGLGSWGGNSGVWGPGKGGLAVQGSVWG